MDNHSEIMNMLGKIDGRLDGIDQRLSFSNNRLAKHDEQIDGIQSWQNNMKGKLSIIGIGWGLLVTALAIVANKLWR